ncbi:MAG: VanZ family protein [Xanthomonadaceae bacterium]|nr:VanZ family protein [Xanthomonadaceae bacterium]
MALWVMAIAIVVITSLVPGKDLPQVGMNDKLEHFTAYGLLSASAVQLFARRLSWGFVCVLLVLMGIGLELLQGAMGMGRTMDSHDALANAMGVLMGLGIAFTPLRDLLLWIDRRLASS